jgi:hypothetical protein
MRGLRLGVGEKRTIDVTLYSEAETSGPWQVKAFDFGWYYGGTKNLELSLDRAAGQNGDVLKLTIEVLSVDPQLGSAAFLLFSELDGATSLAIGAVAPP